MNDMCVMIADNIIKSEHPRCCTYATDGAKDESEDHVVPSGQLIQLSQSQNQKNNERNERYVQVNLKNISNEDYF